MHKGESGARARVLAEPWSSPLIGRVLHLKRREQKLAATGSSLSRLSAARLEDDFRAFANLAEACSTLARIDFSRAPLGLVTVICS